MSHKRIGYLGCLAAVLLLCACTGTTYSEKQVWNLKNLVGPIQKSVVTVATFDLDGNLENIGSGFFISEGGILVTNYHVLDGAYKAAIKTQDGSQYPVVEVLAKNQLVDLVKVRVEIPRERVTPMVIAEQEPAIADRVVVIGSPLGLDQTISEGIVSAIRDISTIGKVYQLSAPISQGSSGSPALNMKGEVIGVVTFQAAKGQNLNFAISIHALEILVNESAPLSLAEWTIRDSQESPALAASLCRQGARLTIQGEYEEALTYFQKAADANPDDPVAWQGLGSCYVGLDQPEDAIEAYKRPIAVNPDNAEAHFFLAMYYKALEAYHEAIPPLLEVIRIDPANVQARFEIGQVYGMLERTDEQVDAYRQILAIKPDHVPSLLGMGMALGKLGQYDEAVAKLNRASELEPANAQIHFFLGATYHRMDQPTEEIQAYIRAIRANPRLVDAHYHLALAYLSQGYKKQALDQYEILKSLDSNKALELFDEIYPHGTGIETEAMPG